MSIVPFDTGRSYIVRSIPVEQAQYHIIDRLGRTQEDREFLERFERIFYAAAEGNLAKCQEVVQEGFRDFKAYSIGKFTTPSGKALDYISPLKVAKLNKRQDVVDYFKAQYGPKTRSSMEIECNEILRSLETEFKKQSIKDPMTEEEKIDS